MRAKRRDGNHAQIKTAFLRLGARVWDTADLGGGFPDLVVAIRRAPHAEHQMIAVEVKDGSLTASRQALTDAEAKFHAYWPDECRAVVTCTTDVAKLFPATPHDYTADQ